MKSRETLEREESLEEALERFQIKFRKLNELDPKFARETLDDLEKNLLDVRIAAREAQRN